MIIAICKKFFGSLKNFLVSPGFSIRFYFKHYLHRHEFSSTLAHRIDLLLTPKGIICLIKIFFYFIKTKLSHLYNVVKNILMSLKLKLVTLLISSPQNISSKLNYFTKKISHHFKKSHYSINNLSSLSQEEKEHLKIRKIIQYPYPFLSISWVTFNQCNYRCSYCRDILNNTPQTLKFDRSAVKKNFNLFALHYSKRGIKSLRTLFTGGEPTLWPHLKETIDLINQEFSPFFNELYFNINTNLSKPLNWWKENYQYFDFILASFHPEIASVEDFIDILDFLSDKVPFSVNIMVVPGYLEKIKKLAARLRKLKSYAYEYHPLLTELSPSGQYITYDSAYQRLFKNSDEKKSSFFAEHLYRSPIAHAQTVIERMNKKQFFCSTNDLATLGLNQFKGWKCDIRNNISIDSVGNLSHGSCEVLSSFGNIYAEKIVLPKKRRVICPKDHCHCGIDLQLEKHR